VTSYAVYITDVYYEACDLVGGGEGELVSIHSSEENSYFANLCRHDRCWIGLYELGSVWKWSDGSNVNYTNWAVGQPDGGRTSALIQPDGYWVNNDFYNRAICTYPAPSPPTATPWAAPSPFSTPSPTRTSFPTAIPSTPTSQSPTNSPTMPSATGYTYQEGWCRTGGMNEKTLISYNGGNTVEDCAANCDAVSSCNCFTFYVSTSRCYLYDIHIDGAIYGTGGSEWGCYIKADIHCDEEVCYEVTSYAVYITDVYYEACDLVGGGEGELVSIHSSEENSYFANLCRHDRCWIGLYELGSVWKWSDGSNVNYTNWAVGQPDGGRTSALIQPDGYWVNNDFYNRAICTYPAPSPPTATPWAAPSPFSTPSPTRTSFPTAIPSTPTSQSPTITPTMPSASGYTYQEGFCRTGGMNEKTTISLNGGDTVEECAANCDADSSCNCFTFYVSNSRCSLNDIHIAGKIYGTGGPDYGCYIKAYLHCDEEVCYEVTSYSVIYWDVYSEACDLVGGGEGELVSIHSSEENSYFANICRHDNCWIGLYELGGVWNWSDGSNVNYTNWAVDQPDGERTSALIQPDGYWVNNGFSNRAICTYPAPSPPTATASAAPSPFSTPSPTMPSIPTVIPSTPTSQSPSNSPTMPPPSEEWKVNVEGYALSSKSAVLFLTIVTCYCCVSNAYLLCILAKRSCRAKRSRKLNEQLEQL